jgi:hypothetical protein
MLKNYLKNVRGLKVVYSKLKLTYLYFVETPYIVYLWIKSFFPSRFDPKNNLIVSLTSFPQRIEHTWLAIETLLQQDLRPSKVVLVLSDQEFPQRQLPKSIIRQQKRGLEILWVAENTLSYKKLLPVRAKYPDAIIVTADDDIFYEPWRLRQLYSASNEKPNTVIGHRGWALKFNDDGKLSPYVTWPLADLNTRGDRCLLTGVGLILYPPNILPLNRLLDLDMARDICPSNDDIWCWSVAHEAGIPAYCLGNNKMKAIYRVHQTTALHKNNVSDGRNDLQLLKAIERLNLSFNRDKN